MKKISVSRDTTKVVRRRRVANSKSSDIPPSLVLRHLILLQSIDDTSPMEKIKVVITIDYARCVL